MVSTLSSVEKWGLKSGKELEEQKILKQLINFFFFLHKNEL